MVITLLKGGLGNQMFQYAAAKGCAFEGEDIYLDLSFLKKHKVTTEHFTARQLEITLFPNLPTKFLADSKSTFYSGKSKWCKLLKKTGLIDHTSFSQKANEFVSFSNRGRVTYLDGFFQSEKYFSNKRNEILKEFEFPRLNSKNSELKKQILNSTNAVSIHIRRGDYITNKAATDFHGVLPLDYYYKALEKIAEISTPDLDIYAFTDDLIWAKQNLSFKNMFFVEGNIGKDSWKDMALMSYCKHHVIANSSFSWWGAWLSQRGGIKCAPKNWFSKHIDYNIHDIIPDNWIIID